MVDFAKKRKKGKMRVILCSGLLPVFSACAVTSTHVALKPRANECQDIENRISLTSTISSRVCWDDTLTPIGMVAGSSVAVAAVITGAALAGAIVGAGVVVGKSLSGGLKSATEIKLPVP